MAKCNPGCQCGKHSPERKQRQREANLKRGKCKPDCKCGHHSGKSRGKCKPDCQCGRHSLETKIKLSTASSRPRPEQRIPRGGCKPDCTCKKHIPGRGTPKSKCICKECGHEFLAFDRRTKYCSPECRDKKKLERAQLDNLTEMTPQRRKYWRWRNEFLKDYLDIQEGKCYLCDDELDYQIRNSVCLDHDHSCCEFEGCPICQRGLACTKCNLLIGYANDDPDRLRHIADNLEFAKMQVAFFRESIEYFA